MAKAQVITKTQAIQMEEQRVINIVNSFKVKHVQKQTTGHCTLKKIAIFIEDSGSALEFIEKFLNKCYPYANIDLISIGGYGNIQYIYKYKYNTVYDYDYTIIMYDRGRSKNNKDLDDNNRKDIPKAIKRISKRNPNTKIYIFSPLCFESIPLSCDLLLEDFLLNYSITSSKYTELHQDIVNLINMNIDRINWINYINSGKSIENTIEDAIEEITKGTNYEISHSPSKISNCWVEDCSNQCKEYNNLCNPLDLNKYNLLMKDKNKLELIAAHSVLGGMSFILDKIFMIKYRSYPKAISNECEYRNKLIEEA